MSTTRDPELEAFKVEIDLRAYATEVESYVLDRKESWKGSAVMRHPNGDKIIIKRDTDGHYVFFSVRDETDNGSIIDFVQKRRPGVRSLGNVRQALRPWISSKRKVQAASLPLFAPLHPTTKDRMEVERQFRFMDFVERHAYLENERRIPYDILTSARFAGRIRTDRRGNAVFPHFDLDGLCGYEIKNSSFTGFAKGGEKGLWFSVAEIRDNRLVICESAIDALSHAALFPDEHTRYASIGGQMNARQPELLRATMLKLAKGSEVIAAFDADDDGHRYAEIVRQIVIEMGRDDLRFSGHHPVGVKDWNDALKSQSLSLPTAQP